MSPGTWWLDALGWAGSAVLILSLSLSNVLRFRALNLLASVVLTVFNALLGIWPMVAMNAIIAGLNVWHLARLLRTRDDESTYEVVGVDARSEYLAHLLLVHGPDVERHNPGFDLAELLRREEPPGSCRVLAFLVLRGDETVGVVVLCDGGDGVARVELDYVTARFRDFSVGTFVYRGDGRLASQGLNRLLASRRMADRAAYFSAVGFHREVVAGQDELVRDVRG
ncbi:hypothetical protein [Aquipuribacter sp. MA13-6]|uniref:hypothetical protein n=1 Tax=unclassified Aquipuribacter TaxID=2635084 RepID=UPI003EE8D8DA